MSRLFILYFLLSSLFNSFAATDISQCHLSNYNNFKYDGFFYKDTISMGIFVHFMNEVTD